MINRKIIVYACGFPILLLVMIIFIKLLPGLSNDISNATNPILAFAIAFVVCLFAGLSYIVIGCFVGNYIADFFAKRGYTQERVVKY